jgi:hypothetical protein
MAAALLGAAVALLVWRLFIVVGSDIGFRASLILGVIISLPCVGFGIFLLEDIAVLPAWQAAIAVGLIAGPCMAWWRAAVRSAITLFGYSAVSRLRRRLPQEAILDYLLDLIQEMTLQDNRRSFQTRQQWMWLLENVARITETGLPAMFRSDNTETDSWVSERAAGAAAYLRRINRQVAAPKADTWDRLIEVLREEAMAFACGDLACLRWVHPPEVEAKKRGHWRTAVTIIRTVVVMSVPVIAVFALQPILKFENQIFEWAKVSTIGWAVLYLLISIDPTLNEKISTARNIIGLARQERVGSQ